MSEISRLQAAARGFAKEAGAGRMAGGWDNVRELMDGAPEAVLSVIELARRESVRKKPRDGLIGAYQIMLTYGLEQLRFEIEREHEWAEKLVEAARRRLLNLAEGGKLDPGLLVLMLNCFVEAKLAPGEPLQAMIGTLVERSVETAGMPAPDEPDELLGMIAEAADNDAFTIVSELDRFSQALPPEFRQVMLERMIVNGNPAVREAAMLYLLDPAPPVRGTLYEALSGDSGAPPISPAGLRRMIAVRNWLPEDERPRLDAAVKAVRRRGVECGTWPEARVEEMFASTIDGAGAQSAFAIVRDGRRHVIASVLVKRGVGVADAWCARANAKADVADFVDHAVSEMETVPVGPGYLARLVSHNIALGRAAGNVPPAGLLDFVETVGIECPQPATTSGADLVALMEPDMELESQRPEAVEAILAISGELLDEFEFMDSWFEDDAEVRRLLAAKRRAGRADKTGAIIDKILEPRREAWAERFLWSALLFREEAEAPSPWPVLFVVGRELCRDRPMRDIPVLWEIAEHTARAAGQTWT